MIKIAFALAAAGAVLMTAPLLVGTVPAKAQNVTMAQGVDVQIGRDRDDRVTIVAGEARTSPSASVRAASPWARGETAGW